jgi:two-component system, LytTR family, response regulator
MMYTAILVDDEKKALDRLERIMQDEPRLLVGGKFTHPQQAVQFAEQAMIDIAFLDIDMPGLDGMSLAVKLTSIRPKLEIVFVTAYERYALDAFRIHAAGYLLKPVNQDDLGRLIDAIDLRHGFDRTRLLDVPLVVQCLGPFRCYPEGAEDRPVAWRTSKAEEMFLMLVNARGAALHRDFLVETLWPEADPDKSANRFRVTCTYLRNSLATAGYPDMLQRENDNYKLDTQRIRCDLDLFNSIRSQTVDTDDVDLLEKAGWLGSGIFLENKSFDWADSPRLYYEHEFKRIQFRLAALLGNKGQAWRGAAALEAVLIRDPVDEGAVYHLIMINLQQNMPDRARRIYQDYADRLMQDFGARPSENVRRLVESRGSG